MPGLIRGVARTAVVAGTATAVSNRVSRRQAGRWADQEQEQYAQQQYQQAPPQYQQAPPPQYQQPVYQEPAPPAPVVAVVQQAPAESPDMNAKLAQLQQLGELKAQGILTDAEFEVQKQRILSS
jgi:Short C-terminal domain